MIEKCIGTFNTVSKISFMLMIKLWYSVHTVHLSVFYDTLHALHRRKFPDCICHL